MFFESSTRTSASFELAAKRLSADTMSMKASGSSVEKGESLKDTALTLSAYDPDVIVIRHPQIGAPQLVASVTDAHVVNAGDGKHQHPTQALLDLYTIQESLGRLEGVHVAIVGDVLHSRVARSLIQALRAGRGERRARRAAAAPAAPSSARSRSTSTRSRTPTSSTSSGCSASGWRRARTTSRRSASTAPAGASRPSGCAPAQKVMHPGPMNRGVEIDPRVADSSAGADRRPGARRARRPDGGALRPADHRPGRRSRPPSWGWRDGRPGARRQARHRRPRRPRRAGARPDRGRRRHPRRSRRRRHDRGDRRAARRERPPGRRRRRARARAGVHRPARPPAHARAARTRRRSRPAPPRRRPAATARSSRCRTPTRSSTRADVLRGLRARAEAEAEIPVGFTAAITVGQDGTQLTEMGELADGGRRRLHRRRPPGRDRRADAARARVQRDHRPAARAPLRGADAHPRRPHAHGRRLGRARARRLALARREPRRLTRALARRRHPAAAPPHAPLGARVGRAAPGARAAGVEASGEVTPHHLCLTDEAVRSLDPNLKMNPPLRTERRPRRADRGARRRDDRGDRDRPRPALARGEGRAVRGGAVRGHRARDRVRGPQHLARRAGPARRSRRCSSGCRPGRPGSSGSSGRGSPSARRANLVLLSTERDVARTRGALPLALGELVAARPQAPRQGADDGRRPAGSRTRHDGAVPGARGRHRLPGRERRRAGDGARRGGVHDGDDRLPGGRRPTRASAARSSASPRRWSATTASPTHRSESAGPHVRGVVMREARGPEWTDWLARHGIPALTGVDTRSLTLHLREHGALRSALVARTGRTSRRAVELARSQPSMAGQALAVAGLDAGAVRVLGRSDVRVAVVDYGAKRSILRRLAVARRRGDRLPARRRRGHARRLRRRRPLERPRRPRAARRGDGDRARAARPGAGARDLPRPPAARARDRALRPSSCRSATAARTTPWSSARPAGCS